MSRRFGAVGVWFVLSGSCSGGQSGDPGVQGPHGPGPETIVPETDCERTRWLPDEAGPSTHRCEVANAEAGLGDAPVSWSCDCGGAARSVEALRCRDALLDACDVSYAAAQYCQSSLGTCLPENEGGSQWLCRCSDASPNPGLETPHVEADDCYLATSLTCAERCESSLGSCETSRNTTPGFTCECRSPASQNAPAAVGNSPVLVETAASCEATLSDACGESCETETGQCTFDSDTYTCTCADAQSANVELTALSSTVGEDLCHEAVAVTCGVLTTGEVCSSATPHWAATCSARAYVTFPDSAPRANTTFDCDCAALSSDAGAEAMNDGGPPSPVAVEARDCEAAIQTTCPGAIPAGSDPNGPTLDYGHPCTGDAQCSGGACYVPGTQRNPICSKRCETDDECPDFARCVEEAGGYCFVRCSEDDECLALNPAITNPLYCSTAYDPNAPGICVQESEP